MKILLCVGAHLLVLITAVAQEITPDSLQSTPLRSPFKFGTNENGKLTVLKSGDTWPVFFVCGTNGGNNHSNAGFNTVFYELYADVSPESEGKSYDELERIWKSDLEKIAEDGYAVIIYIHNHNHDRDKRGYFPFDEEWKARVLRFVNAYKDLPNLAGWAFSDEPSDHIGYPTSEYHTFLKAKYSTIEDLNKAWNTKHDTFEEIVFPYKDKESNKGTGIPLDRPSDPSLILGVSRESFDAADFKLWRVREAHRAFESTVRSVDAYTPLWSGAHNLMWATSQVPDGWGAWCDAYPTYSGNDWFTHHVWFQSVLRGQNFRPVIPMLMVETSDSKKWNLDPKVWNAWMVQGALQGSSGLAFWPWSLLGEVYTDGEAANADARRSVCGDTISTLERSGIFGMKPDNTLAVLYQPYAEGWSGQSQVYGLLAKTGDEPLGLIEALTFGTPNGAVDYLTNDSLLSANLDQYGVIMAPLAADVPPELMNRLTEYVKNGGILLADMGFSSKNSEGHLASMTVEAKKLFGISKLNSSRMEGRWELAKRLPAILDDRLLTLPDDISIRAQLSVKATTAKPVLQGPAGQGLFVNSVGKGYAFFYSGMLWNTQSMANDVIQKIHLDLFKNRAKVAKTEKGANGPRENMLSGNYQILKYSSGYAVANLVDEVTDVCFEVDGKPYSMKLAPRKTYFFDGNDVKELGAAFHPAPAIQN